MNLKNSSLMILVVLASTTAALASPEIPGSDQQQPIALVGATIHTLANGSISKGVVLFDQGRLLAVDNEVEIPENAETIDLSGRHVYPPLFDSHTNLGLIEINAVRATRDIVETGQLNPNVRAEVAVNPDSELIPVTRSGGVLLCLTAPSGSLLTGTSAVLQLDGWSWEDMTLASRVGMHLVWPKMTPSNPWWERDSRKDQIEKRDKSLRQLDRFFADARTYVQSRRLADEDSSRDIPDYDARLDAMIPVLEGQIPLIVRANELQQIQAAVAFAHRENVRLILSGGYDAPRCAALLRQHDVPVIVGGVYRLPRRRSDPYDAPFTLPARLHAAKVQFCLASTGYFGAANVRNLPYHAGMSVAFGLPHQEAIKSVTLYPAEILGVADRVGSLEPGKDATLIVTNGDPLEASTQVEMAFIQGRRVDLNDRHKRLWKKYQEKYRRQQAIDTP